MTVLEEGKKKEFLSCPVLTYKSPTPIPPIGIGVGLPPILAEVMVEKPVWVQSHEAFLRIKCISK